MAHSITSSARIKSVGRIVNPSALTDLGLEETKSAGRGYDILADPYHSSFTPCRHNLICVKSAADNGWSAVC